MKERTFEPDVVATPVSFKKSKTTEVGGRILLMGAAALTAVGVDKSEGAENETFTTYGSNTSPVKFSENNEISSSILIALDPAGDEHPSWVDFTQVYMESDGVDVTFRFHLSGDPTSHNTELKTDTGYSIVFIDKETREGKFYAYAFGGQKTKDVGVQIREFSKAITGFDNVDINTIPNNGAKDDQIIYEAGEEAVTTKSKEVAFTIPQAKFDEISKGNEICVWTTEGTGHGNEVKKENGIQAFNKDHNCQFIPGETPKPTPAPIVPVPTPEAPKGLPETGGNALVTDQKNEPKVPWFMGVVGALAIAGSGYVFIKQGIPMYKGILTKTFSRKNEEIDSKLGGEEK